FCKVRIQIQMDMSLIVNDCRPELIELNIYFTAQFYPKYLLYDPRYKSCHEF
ncbi:hypothetical protein LEFCBN_LEFCBN_14590, partial [Dysosmobacter welbionis]